MKAILSQLNQEVGVKGSLVVTPDGMVVASELGPGLEEEVVAAMASNMVLSTQRALGAAGSPEEFRRLVLTAQHGKMVFVDAGSAYLVVVADRSINIEITMIEIQSAAFRIKGLGEIRI